MALASGMLPIADGSDMGGSLRNPGNFCNVVGLRPSPGRVPVYPAQLAWAGLSVLGPMARTVEDAALLLSAMAGPDARSPISLETPGERFAAPLERELPGRPHRLEPGPRRPARRPAGDGRARVRSAASSPTSAARSKRRSRTGAGADEVFKTLRAWTFSQGFAGLPDAALAA